MRTGDMEALVEQLVETVRFLCNETADLVDERSTRPVHPDDAPGIRLKADKIRVAGRTLQGMLDEAHLREK